MNSFRMDSNALDGAGTEIGGEISHLVTAANASTAGIALSATMPNAGFLTSQALMLFCGTHLVEVFGELSRATKDHGDRVQQAANEFRTRDDQLGVPFSQLKIHEGS